MKKERAPISGTKPLIYTVSQRRIKYWGRNQDRRAHVAGKTYRELKADISDSPTSFLGAKEMGGKP